MKKTYLSKHLAFLIVISMLLTNITLSFASDTGGTVSLSISKDNVTIVSSTDIANVKLVLASYCNYSQLIDIKIIDVNATAGITKDVPIPDDLETSDPVLIKAMLLNSLNDCKPLADSAFYGATTISYKQLIDDHILSNYILVEYRKNPEDRYVYSYKLDINNLKVYLNNVLVSGTTDYLVNNVMGKGDFYGEMVLGLNGECNYDFNTVYITDYQSIVVNSLNDTTITPYNNVPALDFKNLDGTIDATLYDTNGNVMNWYDLKQWDVVSYTKAFDGSKTIIKGWLINNNITGTVNYISSSIGAEDTYGINGKEYCRAKSLSYDDISLGDTGTFYLDKLGNIIFLKTTNTLYSNYAYIIDIKAIDGFTPTVMVKLLRSDGIVDSFLAAPRIALDGISINTEDMIDSQFNIIDVPTNYSVGMDYLIKNQGTDYFTINPSHTAITAIKKLTSGQLVNISQNSLGQITKFDRPTKVDNKIDGKGKFSQYKTEFAVSNYNNTNKTLTVDTEEFNVTENTVFLLAPSGCMDESKFEILNPKNFEDVDAFKNVTLFNVNQFNEIGAVVINDPEFIVTPPLSSTFIIANGLPGYTTNDEGDMVSVIRGMRDGEILPDYLYTTSGVDVSNINIGTVFIPLLNGKGEVESIYLLSSVDNYANKVVPTQYVLDKNKDLNGKVHYYYGKVKQIYRKTVTLNDPITIGTDSNIKVINDITIPAIANFYIYDERQSSSRRVSEDGDISDVDAVYNESTGKTEYVDNTGWDQDITSCDIFVREYDGDIADVVLYIFK